MTDTSGQAEIRGIDIDKLAKGFADEEYILKRFCNVTNTAAREIRWYKRTAGTLDSTDTTGITASQIYNAAGELAIPTVVEQSWTRQTSYVKTFMVESPTLSDEDIKDSDVDVLATNVRDLVRAVAQQVNIRIFSVLVEAAAATPTTPNPTNVNTAAATGTGWDDDTDGNPITDILYGKTQIYSYNYNPEGAVMVLHPEDHEHLIRWLISTKGSSIPNFSSEKIKSGVVMEILGLQVVVTTNVTKDNAYIFVPQRALTWKQFTPLTTYLIEDKGIGTKIRIKEQGEALLTDPKAVHIITDTITA